jgi:ketosteroid isomerase-like protein
VDAVTRVAQAWLEALGRRDGERLRALLASDAVLIDADARRVTGSEAIMRHLAAGGVYPGARVVVRSMHHAAFAQTEVTVAEIDAHVQVDEATDVVQSLLVAVRVEASRVVELVADAEGIRVDDRHSDEECVSSL